jgi:hypothetical protein
VRRRCIPNTSAQEGGSGGSEEGGSGGSEEGGSGGSEEGGSGGSVYYCLLHMVDILTLSYTPRVCTDPDLFKAFYLPLA